MKVDSLSNIYKGFQKLTENDRAEYLKYFALVIGRTQDKAEKNRLVRFKSKLEKINGGQKSQV
jgi:hypothetical protein